MITMAPKEEYTAIARFLSHEIKRARYSINIEPKIEKVSTAAIIPKPRKSTAISMKYVKPPNARPSNPASVSYTHLRAHRDRG